MTLIRTLARAVALTTLAGAAGLAAAQTAASAATSSPAKKELVAKVVQMHQPAIENLANQLAGQPAQQLLNVAAQALRNAPAEKRDLLGAEIQAEVRKFFEDVAPGLRSTAVKLAPSTLGATLEERLSEDELKTLIAWMESPVSRKYQQLIGESQQALQQKLVTETRGTIEPKLKALEASVGKKLGVPGPAASGPAAAPAAKASGAKK